MLRNILTIKTKLHARTRQLVSGLDNVWEANVEDQLFRWILHVMLENVI